MSLSWLKTRFWHDCIYGTWQMIFAVVDDGGEVPVPMPMPMPMPGTGAGLQGMRERVAAVGGTFSVATGDRGFQARARFPRVTQSSGGPG